MAILLSLLPAAGHDQLWFLLMAERWLHGATLYGPYLFDSNPPLIVWLSAIPVSLGELLHLPATAIAKLLVLLAELASASLSLLFLRRLAPLTQAQLAWLTFAFIIIFNVVPARDLGQRDHLTAILCLPYILAAANKFPIPNHQYRAAPQSRSSYPRRPLRCHRHLPQTPSSPDPPGRRAHPPPRTPSQIPPHQPTASNPPLRPKRSAAVKPPHLLPPTPKPSPHTAAASPPSSAPNPSSSSSPASSSSSPSTPSPPPTSPLALPTLRDTYWAIGHLTPLQLLAEAPQLHLLGALTLALFLAAARRNQPSPFRPAIRLLLVAGPAATLAFYLQGNRLVLPAAPRHQPSSPPPSPSSSSISPSQPRSNRLPPGSPGRRRPQPPRPRPHHPLHRLPLHRQPRLQHHLPRPDLFRAFPPTPPSPSSPPPSTTP